MSVLGRAAREEIRAHGITVSDYIARFAADGWVGDRCGCPDDRCIGFHHDDADDCSCLRSLLNEPGPGL